MKRDQSIFYIVGAPENGKFVVGKAAAPATPRFHFSCVFPSMKEAKLFIAAITDRDLAKSMKIKKVRLIDVVTRP